MDKYWRDFLQMEKLIKRVLGPQLDMQSESQSVLDTHRLDFSNHAEPYLKVAAQFEREFLPLFDLKKKMEQFTQPGYGLDASAEKVFQQQSRLQSQVHTFLEPQVRQFDYLKRFLSPEGFLFEDIERLLDPLNRFMNELASAEVYFTGEGSLFVDGQEFTPEEIDGAIEHIQTVDSHAEFLQ